MDKFINLNSAEWCDLVFEGRNKSYGAYKLRQTSSKRYIVAFILMVAFTALVTVLPQLYGVVENLAKRNLGPIQEVVQLEDLEIEEQIPEENIIKEEIAPPPPPLKSTIQFTIPKVVDDEEVTDNQMKTQDDILESDLQVSVADIVGTDEEHGIDIAELEKNKVIVEEVEDEKPFEIVEQQASFPGGMEELNKYLRANLIYPVIAQENGIQGKVILRFVVSKTGEISDIEVLRGVDPSLDREAVKVVKGMPKWIPGRQRGKPVPVYFTLPVAFQLKN
ncbi:TonB family protein [Proteiniphilum sp.]|uniref:energy transducer TonB n=1 Tax=Proteiniphilum sp. TaxID=1926877 RepID=UPI002B2170D8|nr:TonB family protein [Proteiniphilum sp.]MEA4918515.1 TonB family protein [Proteiniphilum sp.]